MAEGELERTEGVADSAGVDVTLVRAAGIVVLDGPQAVIDRLIAGDPALDDVDQLLTLPGKSRGI